MTIGHDCPTRFLRVRPSFFDLVHTPGLNGEGDTDLTVNSVDVYADDRLRSRSR